MGARVVYKGVEMPLAQAVRASGSAVDASTVSSRLRRGWPLLRALTLPAKDKRTVGRAVGRHSTARYKRWGETLMVARHEIPWADRPRDKWGRLKKAGIPAQTRRDIAERHGCGPGQNVTAECFFCGDGGSIFWFPSSRPNGKGWVSFLYLTLDHLIPESCGGSALSDNVVLSCAHCNKSRGNRSASEFFEVLREKERA